MKTNKWLSLAGMFAGAAAPTTALAAERAIEAAELPPTVRRVIDDSGRGETMRKLSVRNAGGRTVYDVEFEPKNGVAQRLRVAEDGKILGDTRKAVTTGAHAAATNPDATDSARPVVPLTYPGIGYPYEPLAVPTRPRLRLEELPQAARETLRREAGTRPIVAIHEETLDGRKAYVAQFGESGRNPRVYVAESGEVVRPTEKPPVLALGTTFDGMPAPARQALRRELGDGEIVRIDKDKEGRGEIETYEVEVKDARGTFQVRVSADGRVFENTRRTNH